MFIQTEETPNPNVLKFFPGLVILETGTMEFANKEEAKKNKLASLLFKIDTVARVFFAKDFISITKLEEVKWEIIKPNLLTTIMEYFVINGNNSISNTQDSELEEEFDESDNEIVEEIKELIYNRVRPAVMQDGGDIQFRKYKNGIVFLKLKGACSGCPSAALTLKDGIEDMLKYYIPEVQSVEAIEE